MIKCSAFFRYLFIINMGFIPDELQGSTCSGGAPVWRDMGWLFAEF